MTLGVVSCPSALDAWPEGLATPINNDANKKTDNWADSSCATAKIKERPLQAV